MGFSPESARRLTQYYKDTIDELSPIGQSIRKTVIKRRESIDGQWKLYFEQLEKLGIKPYVSANIHKAIKKINVECAKLCTDNLQSNFIDNMTMDEKAAIKVAITHLYVKDLNERLNEFYKTLTESKLESLKLYNNWNDDKDAIKYITLSAIDVMKHPKKKLLKAALKLT